MVSIELKKQSFNITIFAIKVCGLGNGLGNFLLGNGQKAGFFFKRWAWHKIWYAHSSVDTTHLSYPIDVPLIYACVSNKLSWHANLDLHFINQNTLWPLEFSIDYDCTLQSA